MGPGGAAGGRAPADMRPAATRRMSGVAAAALGVAAFALMFLVLLLCDRAGRHRQSEPERNSECRHQYFHGECLHATQIVI